MATDLEKKQHQLRITNMALLSLAGSIWDMLGETSFTYSHAIGEKVLNMMEKEMGLEIAGESPEDVLMEINRIFVDEFGFAADIDLTVEDGKYILHVSKCENRSFTNKLREIGVEKPFICPIMAAAHAALMRMGYRSHEQVEQWVEGKGSIITFIPIQS